MNVQFEEEARIAPRAKGRSLASVLVRAGFAKDEASANRLLLISASVLIILSVGIWAFAGSEPEGPTYEELIQLQQREGV